MTEAVGSDLNASTSYTTKAYVEPVILQDSKLTGNAANKTERYTVSENANYSWIGKALTPKSRKNQRVVDNFRKLYTINKDSVATLNEDSHLSSLEINPVIVTEDGVRCVDLLAEE
ncbi:hypothetical protein GLU26_01875 [Nanohaloarchaea archaeon]|nr:hypothetical protein [Candidatus Nanohaloarchaea archaeon]